MKENEEYTISEKYQIMAEHSYLLAYNVAKQLHRKPLCDDYSRYVKIDCPRFIHKKVDETGSCLIELIEAINQFSAVESIDEIGDAVDRLESNISSILGIVEDIKCANFGDDKEVKALLLHAIEKIPQQVALVLQELHVAYVNPGSFMTGEDQSTTIELTVTFDLRDGFAALESWIKKRSRIIDNSSRYGWMDLLAAFGAGWWIGAH